MQFKNWKKPSIQDNKLTEWNWMVQYAKNLKMGKYVDIGAFCYINAKYSVRIENNVQIGSHCSIYSYSTIDGKKGPVVLKNNCKIGTHSVIMPNVTIGVNSVVAAFSFVNKNVPANVVVAGVPIKVVKSIPSKKLSVK